MTICVAIVFLPLLVPWTVGDILQIKLTGFSHFANEMWSLSTCILDVFQLKVRVPVRLSRIPNLSSQHNFVIE